jgi:hypothetical protein
MWRTRSPWCGLISALNCRFRTRGQSKQVCIFILMKWRSLNRATTYRYAYLLACSYRCHCTMPGPSPITKCNWARLIPRYALPPVLAGAPTASNLISLHPLDLLCCPICLETEVLLETVSNNSLIQSYVNSILKILSDFLTVI